MIYYPTIFAIDILYDIDYSVVRNVWEIYSLLGMVVGETYVFLSGLVTKGSMGTIIYLHLVLNS